MADLAFKEAIKAWKYVRHYTENLQKLQVKLRDLGDCTETITREVSEAIGRGDEIEVSVSHWQTDADSSKVDIEQLITGSTTKASISCIACSCPNIVWRYKFSKQTEEKIADAVELIVRYDNFNHQISHPRSHYAENLQKLKDKLRDLGDCRETITRKVSEANGRGDEIEVNVSHWQTDAGSLKDDIEQLIGESTTKANICSNECPCPDITWQYKFSKQAEEKIADADGLIIKYNNFNQISHPRPRPPELESLSDKNFVNFDSRASIFKDIMGALKDSNINMIGVFGLGGVGKTTLVKEVGEQMRKDGTFKQVAMVVVSKDLNVKEVQSKLADSLNFEFKAKADDQERRATELWNKFTNGDKYLIILDDIWKEVKMEAIGIPCTIEKKGCKVVLTSRNEKLLSNLMEVDRNFSIAILSSAEAWTLFMKKVGNSIQSQLEIKSLAYEVCERCKGLPVAINALGEALKGKQEHAWKIALNKLDKYMLKNIVDINPSVFASLKVSYDMLHPADAKSCFLLCCLFAEDAEIPLDELTRFWFAGSFLAQKPCTLEEARNDVYTVVDALKSASLLSNGNDENVVKIHDVIRDVGISIAREEEAFLVDHGALRWPQNPPNGPSYSAISLIFKNINEHPDGLVYPKLHTLTVVNSEHSDLEFPDNFFNGMMQLTMLTISGIRMRRLPSSLAKLKNLRMLYLNECELDDIAILQDLESNLEVLRLSDSGIEALPPEIGQLTSLRVLDLRDCDDLTVIPRGVTSNLTSLEELYFPKNFDKWGATTEEQQGTSSRENLSLEELRRSLSTDKLTTLHIHIPNVKLLPMEDLKFADLKRFRISLGSKFDYFESLISRTCMLKLEGIQLRNEFIPLVDKAEVLVLRPESSVHPLRLFNKLTLLIIEHFKLKYLFSPTTARGLVHLEVLEVTSCEIMEGIVGFEEQKDENEITGEVKFSKLKRLELTSLPNLISFFAKKEKMGTTMGSFSARAQPLFNELVIFPVLEELTIDGLGSIIKIWDKQSVAVLEDQGSFCQLTDLEVAASLALEVEHFEMVGVPKITEIRDKQPLLEPKKEVESLCKLMDIRIEKCGQLLYVFPSHMLPQNLQQLFIKECDELEVIFSKELKEKEVINNDIIVFPLLKAVTLKTLRKLKSFYTETQGFFFSHKVIFPVLESLTIEGLDNIITIWDKQSIAIWQEQGSSCQLMYMDVIKCNKLMHVFPSNMHPLLKNLERLRVRNCETMKGIAEFEGEIDEDGLRNEVASPAREQLEMVGVTEIKDKQPLPKPRKEVESLCKTMCIRIQKCCRLLYVFPSHMLPLNLQELWIEDCDELEVIFSKDPKEEKEAINDDIIVFPRLKRVTLTVLRQLKSFYTETQGFFSHKVQSGGGSSGGGGGGGDDGDVMVVAVVAALWWYLDKITRIWDNQPLSEPEKEAKSFYQLMEIIVGGCDQLEYVLPSYMLPQLKNLQRLEIWWCTKIEVIISNNTKEKEATNNVTIWFPQLKTLDFGYLPNLKSFICSETQLFFSNKVIFPVLKKLSIRKVHKIIEIWDKQSIAVLEEQESFCQLTDLDVSECEKLMHVFPTKMHSPLKNLKVLRVSDCPSMEGIVEFEGEIDEDGLRNEICFSKLSSLELFGLPNLESFCTKLGKAGTTEGNSTIHALPLFNRKVAFPVLESLDFRNLSKITRIWDEQPLSEQEKEAKSFCKLMVIIVEDCDQLEYVLPFYMLPQLKNLEELNIESCRKMEVIISNNSKEKEATNNNNTIRFPQLKTVDLYELPNLKSFICSDETQLFFSNKVQIKVFTLFT
ncbi:hypothetical protein RHGRI_006331 [Rhododendron griersonianum]|uniref:AAA+ ATPase domain-containing protein n=1 Tax=Rhododendron griersonianum TaxID=479676 RepID=A0AAV6KSK2_9ERIC|nr:hypothetical protein RHGRI_006331 [Rhododendron griersonianum]